jgi:hypothetical protein
MLPSLPQIPALQKRKKSIKQMPPPYFLRPMFKVLQEIFCKILHYLAMILQETFVRRCTILQNKLQETWQEFAMFCQQILQKIFCNDFSSDDT